MDTGSRSGGAAQALRRCDAEIVLIDRAITTSSYVYGYLNRLQSSRRLEREAGRNVELMWLLGRLVPDHKTVADFRHRGVGIIEFA